MIGDRIRYRIKSAREELQRELAKHTDEATAAEAVRRIGDGQILAWLLTHGPDIAALVLKLLPLLAA